MLTASGALATTASLLVRAFTSCLHFAPLLTSAVVAGIFS
ncbi:hypothetical protein GQ600_11721 [Phytophthora cactorum]|nr:hypothetical protein GQ600_11721 [Phytophthora cactorum]